MSSLNSNEIHSKKCLIANQQDIEIEKNHFTSILSDQHDETVHSDSDGAKNSSEDICSLNSSNNDEFFENPFKENQLLCDENESDTSVDNSNQTSYQISPIEEFGEVKLYFFYFKFTNFLLKWNIFSLETRVKLKKWMKKIRV